ncbi:conserved hypothetical protein [Mesorhizobium delmotii]|uniref:Uncharacterized protein n=1 Tax=Mesorhizobium delmotii TaxID=1631247 RepID=A0A2P9AEX5_9HYPH|nr:conserved hypothetical protein [Mesorhizobium delmotii]
MIDALASLDPLSGSRQRGSTWAVAFASSRGFEPEDRYIARLTIEEAFFYYRRRAAYSKIFQL